MTFIFKKIIENHEKNIAFYDSDGSIASGQVIKKKTSLKELFLIQISIHRQNAFHNTSDFYKIIS